MLMSEFSYSERQACKLLEVGRSSYRYAPAPDRNEQLRQELTAVAQEKRGTDTGVCTCFWNPAAGRSITSGCTGYTGRRTLPYGVSGASASSDRTGRLCI